MNETAPLPPDKLRWRCDPALFEFETTNQLDDLDEVLGQARALDAVKFGIGIRQDGYNLFVLGRPGTGKRTILRQFLDQRSADEARPSDWCYVQNFEHTHKPKALRLPSGWGTKLRDDMANLIEDLQTEIAGSLQVEQHQNRIQEIERETKQRHDVAFKQLAEKAEVKGLQLIRTPGGFGIAPIKNGSVLAPEEFDTLQEEEKQRITKDVESLQGELKELVEHFHEWRKESREKIKELNREAMRIAIGRSLASVRNKYVDLPSVLEYLDAVEQELIENAEDFQPASDEPTPFLGIEMPDQRSFRQYEVNVLVDNGETEGAPVIYEDHPNYQNLIGRVEHQAQMGTLLTDFTLIKPGALHRANGGYLIVEALKLLQQPFAWEGLKRAIRSGNIKIESLAESLSLVSTVSLEPQPIPLDVKVVLLGEPMLYYLLYEYDRDFAELFKVAADFDDEIDRSPENLHLYARLIAMLVRRLNDNDAKETADEAECAKKLGDSIADSKDSETSFTKDHTSRPFDASAVACVIERAARVADDSEKLTTHLRTISDLIRESDYWASQANRDVVSCEHVQKAVDQQIYRADRLRERMQEETKRGTFFIDTDGEQVGQVNGLSVMDLGNFRFGRPSRITATTRLGKGEVVDIEREVELGGAIHSKGVLIISSLLASRYAKNHPLSLSASIVFEQSYGPIEGDSASVAELCALLSSLADVPIRQSLAVTGSVNQRGQVQPIGGVNEKVEGFFDLCEARGLTGKQGVVIPAANVKHLMLRQNVVEAAADGRFHVYPVATIDEAISLLTGLPVGEKNEAGEYPEGSINFRVESRLWELFELSRKYSQSEKGEPLQDICRTDLQSVKSQSKNRQPE